LRDLDQLWFDSLPEGKQKIEDLSAMHRQALLILSRLAEEFRWGNNLSTGLQLGQALLPTASQCKLLRFVGHFRMLAL